MSASGIAAVEAWLDQVPAEPALEPDLPIVDPHHHLWNRGGHDYRHRAFVKDLRCGHRIEATVYVECQSNYDLGKPVPLRPVGETRFAAEEAAAARREGTAIGICAGIVAHADLALGSRLDAVIDAHEEVADGRLRGVRYVTAWDSSEVIHSPYGTAPAMLGGAEVGEGLSVLARRSLSYDAWVYFTQLDELAAVADAHPDLLIVLDHLGGPIAIGPYAGRRDELFPVWRRGIESLARRTNLRVKLGGLGMALIGYGFRKAGPPPTSATLAEAWRPYFEVAVAAFGPDRAMFESNFPIDLTSCHYVTLWNAFKRLAGGMSADEKAALFAGTARRTYRLAAAA